MSDLHWQPYFPDGMTPSHLFEVRCMVCQFSMRYECADFARLIQTAKADGWRINAVRGTYRYECPACVVLARARLDATIDDANLGKRMFRLKPKRKKKGKKK